MEYHHFKYLVDQVFERADKETVSQQSSDLKIKSLSPLVLAYIGDAYFNLYVRGKLLAYEVHKVQVLHRFGSQMVSAVWQAVAFQGIQSKLTDEEMEFFRRGRNAKSHVPKSATVAEYRTSTGFEALLGALYLQKRYDRLFDLVESSFEIIAREMKKKRKQKQENGQESKKEDENNTV